jgi:hypothetical protein
VLAYRVGDVQWPIWEFQTLKRSWQGFKRSKSRVKGSKGFVAIDPEAKGAKAPSALRHASLLPAPWACDHGV